MWSSRTTSRFITLLCFQFLLRIFSASISVFSGLLFSPSSVLHHLLLGVFLCFSQAWLFLELSAALLYGSSQYAEVKLILLSKDKLFLLFLFFSACWSPTFCELHSYSSIYPPSHAYQGSGTKNITSESHCRPCLHGVYSFVEENTLNLMHTNRYIMKSMINSMRGK